VIKKSASGFIDLSRKAVQEEDGSLWRPVVIHDVFHTVIPDVPALSETTCVPPEVLPVGEVAKRSWEVPFIGTSALNALKPHVIDCLGWGSHAYSMNLPKPTSSFLSTTQEKG